MKTELQKLRRLAEKLERQADTAIVFTDEEMAALLELILPNPPADNTPLATAQRKLSHAHCSIPGALMINRPERLYVISDGHGFSCWGWEVAAEKISALSNWLNERQQPTPDGIRPEPGTRAHYFLMRELMEQAGAYCARHNVRCEIELHPQLKGLEGKRIEVTHNGEIERFWVGKSTGWLPCHLRIATRNSTGGTAVSHRETLAKVRILESNR